MKIITPLIFLFFFTSTLCNGQIESFTAFDGTLFNLNDTIILGKPSTYTASYQEKAYKFVYSYSKIGEKEKYRSIEKDQSRNKYQIKKIAFQKDSSVIFYVGNNGQFAILINEAIKVGEVFFKDRPSNGLTNQRIGPEPLFFMYCKLNTNDIDTLSEDYLYRFMKEDFKDVYDDEFEYWGYVAKAKEKIVKQLDSINEETLFGLEVKMQLGDYDFKNEGFAINLKKNQAKIFGNASKKIRGVHHSYACLSYSIETLDKQFFLKMPKQDAASLIKRKKNKSGKINRDVFALLHLQITSSNKSEVKYLCNELKGRLIRIEFFESESLSGNYLGTIEIE